MKYECYLCGKSVQTNDLFGRLSLMIEDQNDIVTTLKEHKICGWCVHRFDFWQRIIQEKIKEEKTKKSK